MKSNVDKLISQIQINFTEIKMCENLNKKMSLIQQTQQILNNLQKQIQDMDPGYQKNRFEKQLKTAKNQMKQLAIKTQQEMVMRSKVSDITHSLRRQTSGQEELEQKVQIKYNPRLTIQQNLLRNIVMIDLRESKLMIQDQQIEDIARKMEATKGVIQQIAQLINQQGQQIDIITSHIQQTNQNVKKARNEILIANEYQGGDKVEFNQNGDIEAINGKKVQSKDKKVENRIVLNLNKSSALHDARMKLRSGFADFGFKFKSFFSNLFGRGNK